MSGAGPDLAVADGPARRVLFLVDTYWTSRGGTEGQMRALIERLPPRVRVEMWVVHESAWLDANPYPCPHRSLKIRSLKRWHTLRRTFALPSAIRRGRFDLIQTWMGDASVLGPVLGKMTGVPVLVSRRDLGFWMTPPLRRALRVTDRLAAGFVANCEAVKQAVVDTEAVAPERIHVIHNGHDPVAFDGPRDPGVLAQAGVPAGAEVVCLAANLKPLKRQRDLVAAVTRLAPDHPRLHALFLGHGPHEHVCGAGEDVHPSDRVHLYDATDGAIPFLRECTVGVLCSETEGLSNAILEYMGCGLPVVATAVGGNVDLVRDGANGFLYPVGDVAALADRLGRLLRDPALRERMGRASRARFEAEFGIDRMVSETVALWDRLLSSPHPG